MADATRINQILSYIHENYNKKITADNIADHIKISRGECFRCFKRHMDKGLVEYINEYRLAKAAEFLKTTDMSVIDISTECGFENASYFGKMFKNAYNLTPLGYKNAFVWTDKTIMDVGGCDYEYWKDYGKGKMIVTGDKHNGTFICEWDEINNIVFRGGRKFHDHDKTHDQIGNISLTYDAEIKTWGDAYLCVYGWTVEPLVEWYIIEEYSTYKPPSMNPLLGIHSTDDGTYEIFTVKREKRPSIIGDNNDFDQYWSVRTSERSSGTVDVSAHFRTWESLGLTLGKLAEVSLNIEGWKSRGSAIVRTNKLIIEHP